jgi:hypothetical protein
MRPGRGSCSPTASRIDRANENLAQDSRSVLTERRDRYPQFPAVLRTFAVPPLGVQTGATVSLPDADPPFVAVTFAKPPCVEQLAVASAVCLAVAVASHFAVDCAVASLLSLAVLIAVLPLTVASEDASLTLVADASAVAVCSADAPALLPLIAVAFALPPVCADAPAEL